MTLCFLGHLTYLGDALHNIPFLHLKPKKKRPLYFFIDQINFYAFLLRSFFCKKDNILKTSTVSSFEQDWATDTSIFNYKMLFFAIPFLLSQMLLPLNNCRIILSFMWQNVNAQMAKTQLKFKTYLSAIFGFIK